MDPGEHLGRACSPQMHMQKFAGKITKAMKMVAASKMRNAQNAVETSRGIVDPFIRLFGDHPGRKAAHHVARLSRRRAWTYASAPCVGNCQTSCMNKII